MPGVHVDDVGQTFINRSGIVNVSTLIVLFCALGSVVLVVALGCRHRMQSAREPDPGVDSETWVSGVESEAWECDAAEVAACHSVSLATTGASAPVHWTA